MREGNKMKVKITEEMARELFGDDVFLDEIKEVMFLVKNVEDYTLDGEYSTFRAIPIGIVIDIPDDEDPNDLDFYNIGVTIAYPKTEEYAAFEEEPLPDNWDEMTPEERYFYDSDFAEWDSQYDTENPEIWDVGDMLPKDMEEGTSYPR